MAVAREDITSAGLPDSESVSQTPKPLWVRLAEMGEALTPGERARLPQDLSEQLDHYLHVTKGHSFMPTYLRDRIAVDPRILAGKPTIRGLRISVEQILKALGSGVTEEELMREYPELEEADFRAVQAYAAERLAEERVFAVPLGPAGWESAGR